MIHRSHEPTSASASASASEIIGAFRAAMIMSKTAKNSNERNNKSKSLLKRGGDYLKNIRNTMDIYDDILIFIVVVGTAMLYYTTF